MDEWVSDFQDWRAATDPTEKRFLHSMLESMRVDLDAARAQLGGSDAGSDATDVEVPGGGGGGNEEYRDARLVCGSPVFFYYVIFFN